MIVATKQQTYSSYRDTRVQWLGEIPSHWDIYPLFALARENKQRNIGNQESNVLSLSYGRIIRRDVSTNFGLLPESFDKYQILLPGDIVLRLTDLQNDQKSLRVGLVKEQGIITSAYVGLKLQRIDQRFCYYLLHSYDLAKVFYALGGGVRQSMNYDDLKHLPLPLPPIREQISIADFLDLETTKIDALILYKHRLRTLLLERRQALITKAVTSGLKSDVPRKESGFHLLEEVPENWEIAPFKRYLASLEQGWSPQCENIPAEREEWGVLKVGCVNYSQFRAGENKVLPQDIEPAIEYEIHAGDLLVSRANTRELLGSAAVVPDNVRPRLLLCDKLYRLHLVTDDLLPAFVAYAMSSPYVRFQIELDATGASSSMQNISQETISNLVFAIPPLAEQLAIVNHLENHLSELDQLIKQVNSIIDHLNERRVALISEVVTGKLRVME